MAKWEFVEGLLFWILETSHFEFDWDSARFGWTDAQWKAPTSGFHFTGRPSPGDQYSASASKGKEAV